MTDTGSITYSTMTWSQTEPIFLLVLARMSTMKWEKFVWKHYYFGVFGYSVWCFWYFSTHNSKLFVLQQKIIDYRDGLDNPHRCWSDCRVQRHGCGSDWSECDYYTILIVNHGPQWPAILHHQHRRWRPFQIPCLWVWLDWLVKRGPFGENANRYGFFFI